jgi:hypothetical protein
MLGTWNQAAISHKNRPDAVNEHQSCFPPMPYTPTQSEVLEAATAAVAVFKRLKLICCLVGGLACFLHGNIRTPNVRLRVICMPVLGIRHNVGRGPAGHDHHRARDLKGYAC